MESRIKRILGRLEDLEKHKDVLRLKESPVGERSSLRLPSTSLVEESEVYGRDKEKDHIINLLLSNDEGGSSSKIGVIPIVGMGGIGKTTLAQLVYNDKKVVECFDFMAWVCVSEQFGVFSITKTLLQSSSSFEDKVTDLNLLQVKLKEKLTGKKFLVVLDDVWNEKPADWDIMSLPFKAGAQGSKIIVTTRIENVAFIMGTFPTLHIGELTEEDCWQLFAKHASGNADITSYPDLETIGKEIVKKCKGLPLAAKTLGGLLRSKLDAKEWENILKSSIWELKDDQSNILPALRLSYHHLPSHLKRCFAYCEVFPKDYEFKKEDLVLLWMAEKLLPNSSVDRGSEEWGEEFFNDSVSRSFFQPSSTRVGAFTFEAKERDGNFFFVMHDLMNDLAKFVAKEYCLQLENGNSSETMKKARYLGYIPAREDPYKRFKFVSTATHLRTFLPILHYRRRHYNEISIKVVDDLLKLRCLRVFSLCGYQNVHQLPNSLGEQRHLRFLDLSNTSIRMLPESVSMLSNLQTLKLLGCDDLQKLPKNMHRLINLRHLDVRLCDNLVEMPTQISRLKSLRILSKFIVGRDSGTKIGELKELSDLHGELHIMNLENVVNPKHALEQAKLMDKNHLETLKLQWNYNGTNDDPTHARDVLDMLLPNRTLKRLEIYQYPGKEFSKWVGCDSFANIAFLELSECRNCSSLPPLGQLPSLKTLHISAFDEVVIVGPEFYGNASHGKEPFSSLEILKLSNMSSWQKWIPMQAENEDGGTFKKLKELEIDNCDKLIGDLPRYLPLLTKLTIRCQGQLAFSLPTMPSVCDIDVCGLSNELEVKSFFEALKRMESRPQNLEISNISSLIPVGCLPTTLEKLDISHSGNLEFLLGHVHESLQVLKIRDGSYSLGSFLLDSFPKLRDLDISDSESLESLTVSNGLCQNLTSLMIESCPNFVSFPKGGFRAPCLTSLYFFRCKKLKLLPEKMYDLLPSLQIIFIHDCPEMESFPQACLPFSLSTLSIWFCDKLIDSRVNWNLQRLPNLTQFSISGFNENVESFPEEGLLPTTTTDLYIGRFPRLKALDNNGLQQLTSLKHLEVFDCPKLLTIPEEGFPTSLEILEISECPLLEKKCKRDEGEYWNKIDRIFCVEINYEIIS
ncbi:putative disease resistance protein At3g14460 [Morus notabilis]|nr:putative disease resistance protein At3g14460 [Morus notabilis]XP_024023779.1 putative disease resistance protein At3g14460 [Morus notabilis]XP_024023780.1 putative disease resistance protein At3g14460 [Morus notabilis]XP_024023781.1 putative disease resistance protein At3g14460 [Morus notabilis]XP_024023782.1 putative disease resistance protein At3g14460 [Morus notabilis]